MACPRFVWTDVEGKDKDSGAVWSAGQGSAKRLRARRTREKKNKKEGQEGKRKEEGKEQGEGTRDGQREKGGRRRKRKES